MSLADFIEKDLEAILEDWEQFAATLRPASVGMTPRELRDLAGAILRAVTEEMRADPAEKQERRKSERDVTESAQGHAAERLTEGFSLTQLIAEYHTLKASVLRRWRASLEIIGEDEFDQMIKFQEALDESLAEAVGWYNSRLEDARDLLNGVLAHDLRSPLGAILTSAEVLLRDESLSPRSIQIGARIRNSGYRIRAMIGDLLDFTRTRLGTGMPIDPHECDMGRIARDVVDEIKAFQPEVAIRLETSGDLSGQWDHARIEQVLSNLIGNGIEHGHDGEPIMVRARGNGDVTLRIHNEGSTIPQAEQRVIFDPLRRAVVLGRTSSSRGFGLGLYVAREIVEAHGGTIEVESPDEDGTTFTVRLPRKPGKGDQTAGMT